MTQPKFRPIEQEDEVRPTYRLAPPPRWVADRPADFRPGPRRATRGSGVPGPDQGYALLLAARIAERVVLAPGEHRDDVIAGAVVIALRRAALFGRAPVLADLELALRLFGYLDEAPDALVAFRRAMFDGLAHDDWAQRALTHRIPVELLRLRPGDGALADGWKSVAAVASRSSAI